MKLKALVSKKVATIALAGTIGLGAVGTATYAAAPGLVDKIVNSWFSSLDYNLNDYKKEQQASIPSRVSTAISNVSYGFNSYYKQKLEQSKKKVDDDVNAYIKEKSTLTEEESAQVIDQLNKKTDAKVAEITGELKAQVDAQFAK